MGDLKLFLQKISDGETEQMRLSVDAQASQQELDGLYLNDWVSRSGLCDLISASELHVGTGDEREQRKANV